MNIQPEKLYSLRGASKLIPNIKYAQTLQNLIDLDIKETKGQVFKAKVLKRNKQKRYFLKGKDILNLIKNKTYEPKK